MRSYQTMGASAYSIVRGKVLSWFAKNAVPDVCMLRPHGVPAYAIDFPFYKIANSMVRDAIQRYLTEVDVVAAKGIAPSFLGKGGEFKTLGAAYIAQKLYNDAHVQVDFVQCPVLFPRLERMRYDPSTNATLTRLAETPFLVMDDFTQVRVGSWATDFLVEVAEARYSNLLPTIWTGNVTITRTDWSALESKYGQAFARRLVEGSKGYTTVLKTKNPAN